MRALLLVDHGSRRPEANAVLQEIRGKLEAALGPSALVAHAHMELAEPTIPAAIDALCARGARSIYLMPWLLAPGRHASEDVPRMCREAIGERAIELVVGAPLGTDDELIALVLRRFRAG